MARYAKILLGCYRTGDANDPAIYSGAIIAVLSDYPLDVVAACVDPRTGLPAQSKWLPTVAEIKDFCEARMRPRRMEMQARQQIAERERLSITDQRPRKTYEELQADCAKVGIFIGGKSAPIHDATAFREAHGVSQADWDAIPNATGRATG